MSYSSAKKRLVSTMTIPSRSTSISVKVLVPDGASGIWSLALVKALLTESKVTQVLLIILTSLLSLIKGHEMIDKKTHCFPPGMIRAHFSLFLLEAKLLSNMKIAIMTDDAINHLYAKDKNIKNNVAFNQTVLYRHTTLLFNTWYKNHKHESYSFH